MEMPMTYRVTPMLFSRLLILLLAAALVTLFSMSSVRAQEPGSITIEKTDEADSPLPEAGFALFDAECEVELAGEQLTDEDGITVFTELALGTYCLVETTVPDGYAPLDSITVEITDNEPAVTVPVANQLLEPLGSIEIVKWLGLMGEPQDLPIAGVGFQLFDAACDVAVSGEVLTDEDGIALFINLELGTYCVLETTPLEGFLPIEPELLTLTEEEPDWLLEVLNEPGDLGIVVAKLYCPGATASLTVLSAFDEPDVDLEVCEFGDASFMLTGDTFEGSFEFDVEEIAFVELDPGSYQITETAPSQLGPVAFTLGDEPLLVLAINPTAAPPGPPTPTPPAPTPIPRIPDTATNGVPGGPAPVSMFVIILALSAAGLVLRSRYSR
jgi:hypothetical protein